MGARDLKQGLSLLTGLLGIQLSFPSQSLLLPVSLPVVTPLSQYSLHPWDLTPGQENSKGAVIG